MSYNCWMSRKNVDPDQSPQNAMSDLDVHCLPRFICSNALSKCAYTVLKEKERPTKME